MKQRVAAALMVAVLGLVGASCSYENVDPNEVGVKVYNGKFAEVLKPGRTATATMWWNTVKITKWKSGIALSVFTAKRDAGDILGDDSIKVSSLEGASLSLDVTVSYRISPTEKQVKCLYRANLLSNDAIRDRLIRPAVQDAFGSIAAYVTAKDIKTTRKGELAQVVLNYLRERFGQEPIPPKEIGTVPVPVTEATQRITQTHPASKINPSTGCGVEIESVLIPLVTLPENIQKSVDAQIKAEADAQRIAIEQRGAVAAAEKNRIEAEGDAAAARARGQGEADANAAIAASLSPQLAALQAAEACAKALAETQAKVASCGGQGAGGGSSTVVIPAG